MKQKFEIEHNGEIKQLSIEPVVYQNKHMYEISLNGEYFVIAQVGDGWAQEVDGKLDEDVFEKITQTIESNRSKLQVQ
jgi:hypothetical protein